MTNAIQQYKTQETTLQMLWRQYMETKHNWYKGEYTTKQESIFGDVNIAQLNALIALPIVEPVDRQIKLAILKERILFNIEKPDGTFDFNMGNGFEEEALNLINQLEGAK